MDKEGERMTRRGPSFVEKCHSRRRRRREREASNNITKKESAFHPFVSVRMAEGGFVVVAAVRAEAPPLSDVVCWQTQNPEKSLLFVRNRRI